jgi:hypothetical protein
MVVRYVGQILAGHSEVLRPREHSGTVPRLSAPKIQRFDAARVTRIGAYEEDP